MKVKIKFLNYKNLPIPNDEQIVYIIRTNDLTATGLEIKILNEIIEFSVVLLVLNVSPPPKMNKRTGPFIVETVVGRPTDTCACAQSV